MENFDNVTIHVDGPNREGTPIPSLKDIQATLISIANSLENIATRLETLEEKEAALSAVSYSGSYNDLVDQPSIPDVPDVPQNLSDLNNDVPYNPITSGSEFPTNTVAGQMSFYTPQLGTPIPVWYTGTIWVDATGSRINI